MGIILWESLTGRRLFRGENNAATLAKIVSYFSGQLSESHHEEKVRMAGLITGVRPYTTKTGKHMGFAQMEDIQGTVELVLFPKTWEASREILTVGQIVIVEGKLDLRFGTASEIDNIGFTVEERGADGRFVPVAASSMIAIDMFRPTTICSPETLERRFALRNSILPSWLASRNDCCPP